MNAKQLGKFLYAKDDHKLKICAFN